VYAWERLRESGRLEEFRASHLTFFVELAEVAEAGLTGGEDQGRVRRQLDEDHANFATAFEWALEHQPEQALRLGAALWRFYSLSRIDEGRRLLTAALRRSQSPSRAGARCLNGLGTLLRLQGALDDAECAFGRAKRLAHALGLKEELGFSLLSDGIVAVERASYDTAEARFNEAMAVAEEAGDLRGFAHALNCLGVVALRRDVKRDATAFFLTALGRFRALNDQWSIAVTTSNLAWISETDGELAEAQDWYEESRQIWEAVGDEQGIAMATADLGRVARRLHDMPRARALLEQALDRFTRLGNRRLATACLVELADIAADRGRADLAARMLGAAAALREDMGTPAWPEERTLEDEVLARARDRLGTGATQRGLNIGRSLSLENAVEMVEADAWPPPTRRRRAR
jgi:tetratricopeptide (TPR) repeat protein